MTTDRQGIRAAKTAIRAARIADLDFAIAVLIQNELPTNGIQTQFTDLFVVAETEDRRAPVGIAAVEIYGENGLLRSVAISSDWQGLGIGRRLVENRISWARNKKLNKLFLLTTTAPDYFKRFGFEIIERKHIPKAVKQSGEFSTDCPDSAIVMSLTLNDRKE